MKKIFQLVLMVAFLVSPMFASTHYILQTATGSGTGADWTNACTAFSGSCAVSAMVRGDTWYVAGGSYAGPSFNKAASGTTVITVKTATVADHGTATGWNNSFVSLVTFTGGIDFTTPWWVLDGQTGGGPTNWTGGFGLAITQTGASPVLEVDLGADNVTVRHVSLTGNSNSSGGGSIAQDAFAIKGGINFTASYFYTNAIGRCPFFCGGVNNACPGMVAEYGYTGTFVSTSAAHSEVLSTNLMAGDIDFRYNLVTHVEGTGGIMWDNTGTSSIRIYGNTFYRAPGDASFDNNANGIIGGFTGGNSFHERIYNNNFVNINGTIIFTNFIVGGGVGDNIVENNLFYNVTASISYNDIATNDYNLYNASGTPPTETHGSTGTGDPFVSDSTLNFNLLANTAAGLTLAAPFTTDPNGTSRGTDGNWDRGAFEFTSNTTWFIRPDGGTNAQCTGKVNAAYSGSGSAQPCAYNHPYEMMSSSGGWAHMVGGDTIQFVNTSGTSDTYLMGEQNAGIGTDWNARGISVCPTPNPGQANGASCILPAFPSGTSSQHTRILGQNAGSCHDSGHTHLVNPTILSGIAGAFAVLDTRSTNFVDFQCIEVTQPDTCTVVGNGTGMCGNLANYVHFAGLLMNYLTGPGPTNLTLIDFAAVGIGSQGILGSNTRGTITMSDVYLIGNGGEGWNADGGGCDVSCEDTGTINVSHSKIAWNGCEAVNYDMTKTYQQNTYNFCMAQSTGAFASGDGFVMIAAGDVTLNVDHSEFSFNGQDGFDALHLGDDTSHSPVININTSWAEGNMGQNYKLGAGASESAINNVSIGDCRVLSVDANFPLNPSGWSTGYHSGSDICRAQGENWVFAMKNGTAVTVQDNTTVSYDTTTYTVQCLEGLTTCISSTPQATVVFQNNTTYAFPDKSNSNQFASGMFLNNGDPFNNGGLSNHNNWFQMRTGCPDASVPEETNFVCGTPGLTVATQNTDGTALTVNPNITASSLVYKAGVNISGITTDYAGSARNSPSSIGALDFVSGSVTVVSIAIAPTSCSLAIGATCTEVCTATMSDSSTQACTSPAFTSATPAHATVNSSTGVVTGVAAGTSLVSATASGFTSNNSTVTVTAATPVTTMTFGGSVTFGGKNN